MKFEKPNHIDIVVGCAKDDSEQIKILKQSLIDIDCGYPFNLIISSGLKPCVNNRNEGLKKTTSNYVLVCDDDVKFIQHGWLKDMLSVFEEYEDAGIVGCKCLNTEGRVEHGGVIISTKKERKICVCRRSPRIKNREGFYTEYNKGYDRIEIVWQVAGACFLLDKRIAGFFPEKIYNGTGLEDMEYMADIYTRGYFVYYNGLVSSFILP